MISALKRSETDGQGQQTNWPVDEVVQKAFKYDDLRLKVMLKAVYLVVSRVQAACMAVHKKILIDAKPQANCACKKFGSHCDMH
ncbi:TPA: hypothetical protein ACH3X1_004910 [Trebouxia sp. C0004]